MHPTMPLARSAPVPRPLAVGVALILALVTALASMLISDVTPAGAAEPVPGGPVVLDGNDPADHVRSITSYIQDVYDNLDANLAPGYVHDGTVAVVGTCATMLGGMGTGQTFVAYDSAAEVEALFAGIGANNHTHLHICSDDDGTLPIDVEDELDKWGSAIAAHVNRGGGLFATGHSFNWLGDLFPSLVVSFGGTSSSYVTTDGAAFFPNLPANTQVSAINHYTFSNEQTTPLLPLLTASPDGAGLVVALGGTTVRFPQISFTGPTTGEIGTSETFTLVAADADGNALSNNAFDWTITGPTTAAGSGSAVTDANGEYTFTFTGSSPGDTRVTVQMTLGSGESAGSAITTTWATLPGAPTITSAVDVPDADGSVLVSWDAPASDGGETITDYVIEYSTDGTTWLPFTDGVSDVRAAEVTGLANATGYQFRVAAVNAVGQGPWSDPVGGTPVGSPTAPDLHTATGASPTSIDLAWDPPAADNGGPVQSYVVQWAPAGTGAWTTLAPAPTTTTANVPGLVTGDLYDFRVAAVNANGQGPWSDVRSATPLTVPDAVEGLRVIEGDGVLTFEWAEPDFDGGTEVTGYEITATAGLGCVPEHFHPAGGGDHAHWWRCSYGGLDNGTTYPLTVAAVNAEGTGAETTIEGTPYGPPDAPDVTITEVGDGALVATWTTPDDNGRPITGYTVLVDGEVFATVGPGEHSIVVTGLANAEEHTVAVKATNAAGTGPAGSDSATPLADDSDSDGDGVPDTVEGSGDGDGDGVPDHLDAPCVVAVPAGRLLDTRFGTGLGGAVGPVEAKGIITVTAIGSVGVPLDGVKGVVLNLTTTNATTTSYVTVWPSGSLRPNSSSVNTDPGQDAPNLVFAALGDDGALNFYNNAGSVDLVADVVGWIPEAAACEPVTPSRLVDTRIGLGVAASQVIGPRETIDVEVTGVGSVPADAIEAVVVNVTTTGFEVPSFLTVWPAGEERPWTSAANVEPGIDSATLVVAKVGDDGRISVYNNAGTGNIVVDVMGYVPADADFNGVSPVRVLDTRNGTGGHGAPLAGGETITVEVVGRGDVPASGVGAVWMTLTSTGATTESFVRAWPTGLDWSTSSVLNTDVGVDTPNLVLVPVGEDGTISLFNHAGSTDLVVDVIGWVPQHGT